MANQRSSNSRLLAIGVVVLVVGVLLVLVIIRTADDAPVEASPVAAGAVATEQPTESRPTMTLEDLSSARLPLPLEVPKGTEAMAVRMSFVRSVAAIPSPGNRVNVYRFLSATDEAPADTATDVAASESAAAPTSSSLPEPGPDSEQVLADVEVLAVTGPLPASNDGVLTVVLAVPSEEVPGLMPLADDDQLWFTLLPAADDPTSESTTDSTEEPA